MTERRQSEVQVRWLLFFTICVAVLTVAWIWQEVRS